jgi:hypothetical protein
MIEADAKSRSAGLGYDMTDSHVDNYLRYTTLSVSEFKQDALFVH